MKSKLDEESNLELLEKQQERENWNLTLELNRMSEEEEFWMFVHKKSAEYEKMIIIMELENEMLDEALLKNLNNYFF